MANINIDKDAFHIASFFNLIAVDLDDDGKPDAIVIVNPDGSQIGSPSQQPSLFERIDKDRFNAAEVTNYVGVDVNEDGEPDALAVINPNGKLVGT